MGRQGQKVKRMGLAFVIVLAFTLILALAATTFTVLSGTELRMARRQCDSTKAFYLADAGVQKALSELYKDGDYAGEINVPLGEGVYDVAVTSLENQKQIDAIGYVPDRASPRAQRKVRAITERPKNPVKAFAALTAGGDVTLMGDATIDGEDGIAIIVPVGSTVSIGGNAGVIGEQSVGPFPGFEEVFGMTEEEMKGLAEVYSGPTSQPDPAGGIVWIDGDAAYTKESWGGDGILIVTGDLRITGGKYEGVIYVMGDFELRGNADVDGAVLVQTDMKAVLFHSGTPTVEYDPEIVSDRGKFYPYEIVLWQEVD